MRPARRSPPPKTVLITGASSGIGEALARHYAGTAQTLILCGRDQARLEAVAADCRKMGATVEAVIIDVTDRNRMAAWIADADRTHVIDLLIANAGISGGTGDVDMATPDAAWLNGERLIFDVNLGGVLNTLEPLIPRMIERQSGQIAIMSSLAGFSGWPGAPAYSASKGAVRLYGEALRGALAPHGVTVSVICPGFIRSRITDMNDFPMPFFMEADRAAAIIAKALMRRSARIAFPWPPYSLSGFLGLLPPAVAIPLLRRFPAKSRITGPE